MGLKFNNIIVAITCILANSFLYAQDPLSDSNNSSNSSNKHPNNNIDDSLLDLSLEQLSSVKVIIASGTEQNLEDAPSVVTVITAEDIRLTGATNLTDALESVPGVHIRYSTFGFRPLVRMRGTNSFQTLLMINGTPMKDLMWAFGIYWKGIPASAIERIEVIRGPGSALYGADAGAGVINVITKTAMGVKENQLSVRTGSFDSQAVALQYGQSWDDIKVNFTADISSTDGHSPKINSDRQTINDALFNTNVSYAPGKAQYGWDNQDIRFSIAKDKLTFLASYIHHNNLETGITGAGVLDPVTQGKDSRYDLDLIYKNDTFSDSWALNAKLHYQNLDYTSNNGFQENPPGTAFALGLYPDGVINKMRSSEQQVRTEVSGVFSGIKQHQLSVGTGYNWQDLYSVEQYVNRGLDANGNIIPAGSPLVDISDSPFAFAPEKSRKIYYAFVQDIWEFAPDWQLTLGARYDNYSDFSDTFNPRMALIWKTTDKLTTKFMYGEAFRAPSFQELYANTSRSLANSNLKPEELNTLEIAWDYQATKNLRLGLNVYRLEIEDFIRTMPVAGKPTRRYQNTGQHRTDGMELEASWQLSQAVKLSGNYSYRSPDNNVLRIVEEPEQDAYVRTDWRFQKGWNWNVQANWIAQRKRATNDPRADISDYVITDSTLIYDGLKQWEFSASVRNLFDENAREHTGQSIKDDLALPERNFYAEVRYKY